MTHTRISQWDVLKRCLLLLARLIRGPATPQELLALSAQIGKPLSGAAALKRFENDRARLRRLLGCELRYDRRTNSYSLAAVNWGLIDFSPEALKGLAFLQAAFDNNAPMSQPVQSLIDSILMLLSEERRSELARQRSLLEVDLHPRDNDEIAPEVWSAVQQACNSHRQLEFDYYSPGHDDRQPRRNRVEPARYYYDTQQGHYYLQALRLEVSGPKGTWAELVLMSYRLGRIRNPRVLPSVFVPRRIRPRQYELVYVLSPEIARGGVTDHFEGAQVVYQPDGSAEVHAQVSDLFMPVRTLLHYGAGCRVIGGPEALKEMQGLAQAMYEIYFPHRDP
jgi:predicted DNA-binding transcriptional regulator YafY